MAQTPAALTQLILRSGTHQVVIGVPLASQKVVSIAQQALASHTGSTQLERLWGHTCAELMRAVPDHTGLSLSIPARAEIPTVWISELEPRHFTITQNGGGEPSWIVLKSTGPHTPQKDTTATATEKTPHHEPVGATP